MPSLSLENRTVAHTSWPRYANDSPDFLRKAGVTHLFLGTYNNEPAYYDEAFPEEAKRARLIAQYRMWRSWFLLYDLRPGAPPPPGTTILEAEAMVREPGLPGMPRFDRDAGADFALRVETAGPALLGRREMESRGPRSVPGDRWRSRSSGRRHPPSSSRSGSSTKGRSRSSAASRSRAARNRTEPTDGSPSRGEFMDDGPYTVEVRSSGAGVFWFDRLEIVR